MKKIILIGVFLTAYCLSYSQWISIGGGSSSGSVDSTFTYDTLYGDGGAIIFDVDSIWSERPLGTFRSRLDNITDAGAESDPVYSGDPASSITTQDLTNIQNLDSNFVIKNSEQVYDSIAFASTINLDLTTGADYIIIRITGDCTINITDILGGESMVILYMDGTGGHTVTLGTGFTEQEGSGTINTDASERTVIQIEHVVGPGGFEDTFYMIL